MALSVVIRKFDEQLYEVAGGSHVHLPATHRHHDGQLTTGWLVEDQLHLVEGHDDLRVLIDLSNVVLGCCEKLSHCAFLPLCSLSEWRLISTPTEYSQGAVEYWRSLIVCGESFRGC